MILAFLQEQAPQIVTEAERDAVHVLPILQALPASDLLLGGVMLVLIILIHGASMRLVNAHVIRRVKEVTLHPNEWRADGILSGAIVLLLAVHLFETGVWTTVLVHSGLVRNWREAGVFAANTYTTLGYGSVILPANWQMLAPIIAISGLFTFGWTGSVLVDIVGRINRLKDMAAGPIAPPASPPPPERKP